MVSNKSKELFKRAQSSIPGGVNSPARAFRSVGGEPVFMKEAKGAYLYDADGNRYLDFINSWGPMILGHAFEPVVEAVRQKALESTSFGAPTELEVQMAELVKSMVPNVDLIRMVSSGTEACMSAIRLARGYTGRNKIITTIRADWVKGKWWNSFVTHNRIKAAYNDMSLNSADDTCPNFIFSCLK